MDTCFFFPFLPFCCDNDLLFRYLDITAHSLKICEYLCKIKITQVVNELSQNNFVGSR